MKTDKITYETGATSHAVNDLILFTDNTRELAKLRDSIYAAMWQFDLMGDSKKWDADRFLKLAKAAEKQYISEFPTSHSHISNMAPHEIAEYCQLYLDDFVNWKSEHGYK